jgi:hypothetical protein
MKPRLITFVFFSMLAFGSWAYAGAQVEVSYIKPADFVDLKSTWLTQEDFLSTLTSHLQSLGKKYLQEGQGLQITITDIDLAGNIEYPHNGNAVRVMRDITPPRITLRWRLLPADTNLPMQTASLIDMNYLMHTNQYSEGDFLRYEKQMLDVWFKHNFAAKPK